MLTHAEADHEGAAPRGDRAPTAPRLIVDGGAGWASPVQRALAGAPARRLHAPGGGRDDHARPAALRGAVAAARPPGWRAAATRTTTRWSRGSRPRALSMLLTADAE